MNICRTHSHHASLLCIVTLCIILISMASTSWAQQPTATVTQLTGTAEVTSQGRKVSAELNMVLTEGDTIETKPNAAATLTLSDGSTIPLDENTKLNLDLLLQTPEKARKSRLKLFYGRLRAFLSPGHQKEGSTFDLETPNAQVGVQFSQPDVEVLYERDTKTTIVKAYTEDVYVLNLLSKAEIPRVLKGHQAVIKESFIMVTPIVEMSRILNEVDRMAMERTTLEELEEDPEASQRVSSELLQETWYNIGTNDPNTTQIPAPDSPTVSGTTGAEPVDASIIIEVK